MFQKFTTSLLIVLAVLSFNSSYSQDRREYRQTAVDGSEVGIPNTNTRKFVQHVQDNNIQPLSTSSYTVNFTSFNLASYYDLQSNGTTNEVWQDPLNPLYVHAAVMVMPVFGSTRYCIYLLSTDRGLTWDSFGNIAEAQSGFPSIDGLSDGSAIVTMHTTAGGQPAALSQVFVDLGPGFGTFNRFNPGLVNGNAQIWGRILATSNIANPIKWVLANSFNTSDIASTTTGSSLTPPGTFSPWIDYPSETAEQYSLALAADGRIGNAFISQGDVNQGDVEFRESTDNGLSWSTPIKIYDANIAVDSLGAFRGISMIYLGNTPCVTFEVDYLTATGLFPTLPSSIYFWSPTVNGGNSKKIAGENNIPFNPNIGPSASYGVYTPLCRPAIGKTNSSSSNLLFVGMNAATAQIAADSNVYYATYLTVSYDGGNSWVAPERITPATPLKDWRYVSLSHTNSMNSAGDKWTVQMVIQNHDYAGAFAPSQPPGTADFSSVRVDVPLTGIREINSSVPSNFSLHQNYPNPFNPTTSIRFDIQKSSRVTLEVYSANGQKVETLIKNEFVTAGTKEISFSGSNLSSGIYFYTLSAGEIKETKKMMLIK
ncbi:MAG TPA: T9SS type A sorting domain-containing protein [Ignavibacteria bacterium]|mgnify:CR=1 FL=1|nr:T9SS type A sorting domain-containing protein [Ignavibacteria bacterium]